MEPTSAVVPEAAPAPPVADITPETQPATAAALGTQNVRDYRAARAAERLGKPLPDVPTPEPDEPVAAVSKPVSKRQAQINDYERRIAQSDQRIRALEDQLRQPPLAPREPPPIDSRPTEPAWKRFAAAPDAPKLADFDSVEEHTAAMALFIVDRRQAEAQQRADGEALTATQQTRIDTFVERLNHSKVSDPEFVNKLTPEVKALRPFAALAPGEASGPLNVIAEQVFDSPIAPAVLVYFSEHPEELARLATVPPELRTLAGPQQAHAHIRWMTREFARIEARLEPTLPAPSPVKLVTSAPAPAVTLGARPAAPADPIKTAVEKGNFSDFRKARQVERTAARI